MLFCSKIFLNMLLKGKYVIAIGGKEEKLKQKKYIYYNIQLFWLNRCKLLNPKWYQKVLSLKNSKLLEDIKSNEWLASFKVSILTKLFYLIHILCYKVWWTSEPEWLASVASENKGLFLNMRHMTSVSLPHEKWHYSPV